MLVAGCDPGEREARPYAGRWESQGFGLFFDIHGGSVDIYEHSEVHCFRVASGSARGISEVLSLEDDRLVLRDGGRIVEFVGVETLPERCADPVADSPPVVFAVAVATISEHYFPAPDREWHDIAESIGSGLVEESSPDELHAAMVSVLSLLGDPEVRLAGGGEEPWPEPPEIGVGLAARWEPASEGGVLVGEAGSGVAYLGFLSLVTGGEADQRALAEELDGALAGAESLVIDLRAASGGVEEAALQVATRFVSSERIVATIRARAGDGLVGAGELSVRPRPTGIFTGRIVVLVGPATSGAGEMLARILSGTPGVTVVGEPTGGSPREPLVRALPNTWSIGVPNLDVVGSTGESWLEPLAPDVIAPTTLEDLEAGRDPGLEAAMRVLTSG